MTGHACPRCGAFTTGSWSEGGLKWAICEDCMRRDRASRDDLERQRGDEIRRATEHDDWSKHAAREEVRP